MFAPQHFAPQHFAPQHFPPILDFEPGGSGGPGGAGEAGVPTVRSFVPIARKREQVAERLERVEKRLSAKAKRRLLEGFDLDRLDIRVLERAVASEVAQLPPRKRVVDPPIDRADITLPIPLLDPADDLNLRLLLLLGC